ncbi:MAG: ABC transporter permease [Oscillospiraceae bacterium]|jgi:ABC-2 type transport system permease protein|nr:ABC transporter permease [Oscillospiraceae bacterium]
MIYIIKKQFLILIRDKGSLFFTVLFPALLVMILGNMLDKLDNPDSVIGDINLQYIGINTKILPKIDGVSFIEASSFEAAKIAVEADAATAAVQFSERGIELYQGRDSIKNRALESVFRGISIGAVNSEKTFVQTKNLGYNRTMLDYYAVTMIAMIVFMGGGVSGASTVFEERKNGTLSRTAMSPKSRASLYFGTVLSFLPQSALQVICTMLPSILIFNAHYANTIAGNLLLFSMFFIVGISTCSVFALVGLFIKINPTMVIMPAVWALMFLSGSFAQDVYITGFSDILPPRLVQNAAFELTIFGRYEKCVSAIIVSAFVLALSSVLGAIIFSRKAKI